MSFTDKKREEIKKYLLRKIAVDDKDAIGTREVVLGKDCFIGCNALILKGTKIGDGSVVGAGSVVCGEFPSGVVIGGNPARVIKTL